MKIHYINKCVYITTNKTIHNGDHYLDSCVHPFLITEPLKKIGFCDDTRTIIQSSVGTTSPVSSSRKIIFKFKL